MKQFRLDFQHFIDKLDSYISEYNHSPTSEVEWPAKKVLPNKPINMHTDEYFLGWNCAIDAFMEIINNHIVDSNEKVKTVIGVETSNEGWAIVKDSTGEICGHGGRAYEVFLKKEDADKANSYPKHGYEGYSVRKVYITSLRLNQKEGLIE